MNKLLRYVRYSIFALTFLVVLSVYIGVNVLLPKGTIQIIRITQWYAFLAVIYLYLALLISPVYKVFPYLPYKSLVVKARRALGVSAFFFAFLHACFAFFGQLGGFAGLAFLNSRYLIAIMLSFTALVILATMASLSFDRMIQRLSFSKWKMVHRFVYLAAFLIVIHALMLGTHFSDFSSWIPQLFFAALAVLLILEAVRIDIFLKSKFTKLPSFGVSLIVALCIIAVGFVIILTPESKKISLNIHSQHIQLAKEAQKGIPTISDKFTSIPGLRGDRTKRFSVSFDHPQIVNPYEPTTLTFQVSDADSGNPVVFFDVVYEKLVHLVMVDSELETFSHIHPELTEKGFTITTQFPKEGWYHLYVDFQPRGAIEQQFGFVLKVGNPEKPQLSTHKLDDNLNKQFFPYEVSLKLPTTTSASEMSIGNQKLVFSLKDSIGKPVTNLKPYLASFGHLVMINQETFDYIHVHPTNTTPPAPNSNGGPDVEFLPLGIYRPIKPGIYRIFAQFNPDNQLFTADFTIKINP